jgi:hypothetical protein
MKEKDKETSTTHQYEYQNKRNIKQWLGYTLQENQINQA